MNDSKMKHFTSVLLLCISIFVVSIFSLVLHGCVDDGNCSTTTDENRPRVIDLPAGARYVDMTFPNGMMIITDSMPEDYIPTQKTVYVELRNGKLEKFAVINENK